MTETLVEIVARAIWWGESDNGMAYDEDKCDMEWNEVRQPAIYARAVLTALRDPPPAIIEAGAKAMKHELPDYFTETPWDEIGEPVRQWWRDKWLASWRAALDAAG